MVIMKAAKGLRKFLESPFVNILITQAVLFSVLAPDISQGWLDKSWDPAVSILLLLCLLLFALELILNIIAYKHWWKQPSFWIYCLAIIPMVFDIPWFQENLPFVQMSQAFSGLLIIKVFRILSRIGRLLRIIRNIALSHLKNLINFLRRKKQNENTKKQMLRIKKELSLEKRNQVWSKMEETATVGIMISFLLLFIMNFIIMDPGNIEIPEKAFLNYFQEQNSSLTKTDIKIIKNSYPDIILLDLAGKKLINKKTHKEKLRECEIRSIKFSQGMAQIDISPYIQAHSRSMTYLTLLIIFICSFLTLFLNWLVSRFSLETSGTLKTLARALDERDAYTRLHSRNVAIYAEKCAKTMGLSRMEQQIIKIAGELHDIGKIGVREDILHKNGPLTEEEYSIMKNHPEQGARILNPLTNLDQVILGGYHHHEKFNGKGYPDGLKGQEIPRIARILAVCDVFDALTTDRPYRKSMPLEKAFSILEKGRGEDFCPDCLDAFFKSKVWKDNPDQKEKRA